MRDRVFWKAAGFLAFFLPALLGAGSLSGLTWESPVFTDGGEAYRPKEELVQEGKTYRLVSTRIRNATKPSEPTYASANVSFFLEGKEQPPDTARISITDETAEITFEREVPRLEMIERGAAWSEDFSFPLTVADYDAESYLLGDTEIPADVPLLDYGEELLAWLKLPLDCYRVETVDWDGPPYEKEGVLFRDALAKGAKLMRNVEVKYGGQVMTPEIRGKQYIGIYEEAAEEETKESVQKAEKARAQAVPLQTEAKQEREVPLPLADRILQWLTTHLTVVRLGIGFFAGLLAVAALWGLAGRKKKKSRVS
ncbi:MAG: hypothetical protein HFE84_02515 [Lachnospiraceae bacterium]|nr:hypothetical protein [Lachnospiraceae bacterium]